ncbi:MAG: ABC transporter substrate-binding protein, partial [Candidatus Pacebacteria bacterium]|nr:ABC transporter substrate-binding protein [Candidatus Paceibacterota bacterium]
PKQKKITKKKNQPNLLKIIISFSFLFVIGLIGSYLFFQAQKPKQLKTVKIGLAWINQAQFAGIYTAIEKGYYEKAGLKVEIEEFDREVANEIKLAKGDLDFTISQPVVLINKISEGLKLKAISAIYQTSPLAYLYKSELQLEKPSDFKGKTLGIKGDNLAGKILFSAFLSELNLTEKDFHLKQLDFTTHEFDDIQSSTVDVMGLYRTNQPYTFDQNGVDYKLILPEDFGFDMYGDVLVTSDEMIEKNPKLVQKFVDATLKGWEYALENQDEAVDFTKEYITSDAYQEVEYNKYILKESAPIVQVSGAHEIGYMTFDKWDGLYNSMLSFDSSLKGINVDDIFTTQFIE